MWLLLLTDGHVSTNALHYLLNHDSLADKK